MIIDKINMVVLDILSSMAKQLEKACGLSNDGSAVFGGLSVAILIGDIYQFAPISGRPLWGNRQSHKDYNWTIMWQCYLSVITLTQYVWQQKDLEFISLLQQAQARSLTQTDVFMLNNRVMTALTLKNLLKNIFIVEKNETRYLINRLQLKKFARSTGRDIITFSAEHSYLKKTGGRYLLHKDLFSIQDGEHGATRPSFLYYCKRMLIVLLLNIYILLEMVNGACATIYGIIFYPNSMHSTPNF